MEEEFEFFKREYNIPFGHDRIVPYLYLAENQSNVLYSFDRWKARALIEGLERRTYCPTLIHVLITSLTLKRGGTDELTKLALKIKGTSLSFDETTRKTTLEKIAADFMDIQPLLNTVKNAPYKSINDVVTAYTDIKSMADNIRDFKQKGDGPDLNNYITYIKTQPLGKDLVTTDIQTNPSKFSRITEFFDRICGLFYDEKDALALLDDIIAVHPYKFKNLQAVCDACKDAFIYLSHDIDKFKKIRSVVNPVAIADFLSKAKNTPLVTLLNNIDRENPAQYLGLLLIQ